MSNNKEPLYFFVTRDNMEACANLKPHRILDYINDCCTELESRYTKSKSHILELYNDMKIGDEGWYNSIWDSDYGTYQGTELDLDCVYLPDGFIKTVLGKEMTFEDEPVLFDNESVSNKSLICFHKDEADEKIASVMNDPFSQECDRATLRL